eukprot:CAMPEP_0197022348 /NCGR_PEP_ID=MMETSP1384-20130603/3264_1 /TAXON_ID=29189 /ORGANISM="Ammonia sp." /LENGTH=798 /DNA_ID=CAMNT_0042450381 /DNA_START=101 /DNA_END=2497 /DNA_ORIENTATION=+
MSLNKPADDSEEQKSEDYRTLVLRQCFQRIPKDKQSESLKVFHEVLAADTQTDFPSEVTQEMFVNRLNKLVRNLNLYDLHRKLATATYRSLNSSISAATEQKKDDYRLFGAADESYAGSVRFDLSAEAIKALVAEIEQETDAVMDGIAALDENDVNTNNTLLPLIQLGQRLSGVENSVCFLQNVSPSKEIRDASNEAEKELNKHAVEVSMRKDVYHKIKAYSEKCKESIAGLDAEWRRFLEFTLRDYRRAGLDLEDKSYERIKEIKKRMSTISSQFQKNCNEENTKFIFEEAELDGMSADWLKARLITDDSNENKGKYEVNIKYPSLFPVLQQCKVEKTRETMLRAHNSRCMAENTPIMEELVKLRYEHARLLGKASHADYVLETRMAKTAQTVSDFLHDLNAKMEPLAKADMAALLKLKQQEKEANQEEFDGVIHEHDFRYYCRMREGSEFAIDKEALRPFFPIQTVIDGALDIYQSLLGVKFLQIKEEESQFQFWHNEVLLYQVQDSESKQLMGYFFLDLHPREGKYGHACKITLQTGCNVYDNHGKHSGQQLPINVLLCNFPKPSADKPSLLSHDDVVTFFHEFGHSVHQLIGQPACSRFAGTAVERDFVEAPSQMLENWCWKSTSLNLMSGHYEDSSRKIPADSVAALAKSKNANCGLLTKRQLYFGILDQTMHTVQNEQGVDTAQLCVELQPKIWGIEVQPGTNFVSSFAHLAGGYDAQYYGYMWSEVFSADMFYSVFYRDGDKSLLDPANGRAYREKILAPGGSRDAIDLLKDFLGREPNNLAFLKEKGLQS